MNKFSYVSKETRQRVEEVVERLGYRPSTLARSLIQQRSYTLGVVTAGLKYIGPSRTLNGITSAAEELGYSLLLKELPRFDAEDVLPIFQGLHSRHVDGIIWAVPEVGENRNWIHKQALDLKIPVVYLTMESKQDICTASVDNYLGGRVATLHLLEQGYRHIGHITGPLDWWEARQRMRAWKDTLHEYGLTAREEQWAEGNWSPESAVRALEKLFEQYPEMDSIFVSNDQMALAVLQVACQRGLRIPDQLGLVGFDDIPESAYFCPPLTTIQQDQYAVGKVAVEQTIHMIEAGRQAHGAIEPKSIMLAPTLVVRQSSLRLPKNEQEGDE
jgi:LacI family transcriptional regulator